MSWDLIAGPLGHFLVFIYNIAFHNYGLAIIIFTLIVRLALMPLTFKQYQSSAKMQKLQPQMEEIKKRYKDDKEKLNQEMMKLYQENNYNPASGCLPMLVQLPIIMSLYWVIIQPLKFMLDKSTDAINKIVEVAASGLGKTVQQLGIQKELLAMSYFSDHQDKLPLVSQYLSKSELIDFNSFLGLHLGETASYQPEKLFGPQAGIFIPLFILVILATIATYFSSKLAMPNMNNNTNSKSNAMGCTNNSMLLMGPVMTLMFSFTLPAGVILYWMAGYVVAIFQQLYVNKHILKKNQKPDQAAIEGKKKANGGTAAIGAGDAEQAADGAEANGEADTTADGTGSGDDSGNATKGSGDGKQNTGTKKPGNKSGTASSNGKYSGKNKKGGKKK